MTLNRLTLSLLLAISFPAALIGCQSNIAKDNSTPANSIVTGSSTSAPVLSEQVINVESVNRFDWKLVRWIDNQSIVNDVDTVPPLMLDVRPSNLVFKYDCQRYRLNHDGYQDYTYSSYGVTTITQPSCLITNKQAAHNIFQYLERLFPEYGRGRFNLRITSPSTQTKSFSFLNKLTPKKPTPYELVLNVQDKQLVFEGTFKTLQPVTGLAITYEFLKEYQWRLVSAVDSNQKTIIELSRPDFPVTAYFAYPMYNDEHHVGFSSDCNGVGGSYILTPDNKLLIGSSPQTMMGCSPKREAAEDKIRELEQLSKSQLTLQRLPNTNLDSSSLPYYLLTQKLDTGETLIWKNEIKKTP
ncbi:META domain-containing protein [Psychrobacter immobilis]|uniref:META domain-containing protein n=1 Tax=Psychrobacter immobilis TaxID=498 RepID=UPI00191A8B00|nr:META domain-containing protein [Psychrobacter immobilis]